MSEQMKLSEAIREGAKVRPQGFGRFFTEDADHRLCSCALGAAYEVLFGLPIKSVYFGWTVRGSVLENAYPHLLEPFDGSSNLWLTDMVSSLNDKQKKTREQIADWLEEKGY